MLLNILYNAIQFSRLGWYQSITGYLEVLMVGFSILSKILNTSKPKKSSAVYKAHFKVACNPPSDHNVGCNGSDAVHIFTH